MKNQCPIESQGVLHPQVVVMTIRWSTRCPSYQRLMINFNFLPRNWRRKVMKTARTMRQLVLCFDFGQDDATFSAGVTFPRHNVMFLFRRNCRHVRMAEAGAGNPVRLQHAAPYRFCTLQISSCRYCIQFMVDLS